MAHGRKTGGRTVGTPNKATKELRDQLQQIIQAVVEELPEILAGMEPAERTRVVATFLPYVMPKLTSVDLNAVNVPDNRGATLKAFTAEEFLAFEKWQQEQAAD